MVLIVNKRTGDVLRQYFHHHYTFSEITRFEREPARKLRQNLFLDDPGEKVFFLLNTNESANAHIDKYLDNLRKEGVVDGGMLQANVSSFPGEEIHSEEQTRIYATFQFDLGFVDIHNE